MFRLHCIWHACYLSLACMFESYCIWHAYVALHCTSMVTLYLAYMHCIVFGLGCQTKHEERGAFVLEVTKHASILDRQHS